MFMGMAGVGSRESIKPSSPIFAPTLARWTTSFLSPSCIPFSPAIALRKEGGREEREKGREGEREGGREGGEGREEQ